MSGATDSPRVNHTPRATYRCAPAQRCKDQSLKTMCKDNDEGEFAKCKKTKIEDELSSPLFSDVGRAIA